MNYKAHKLPKHITGIPRCSVPVSPNILDNGMPQVMIAIQVYDNNNIMSVAGTLRLTPNEAYNLAAQLTAKASVAESMIKKNSLVEAQAANIARLQCELDACIESGDEYHAAMIRDDINTITLETRSTAVSAGRKSNQMCDNCNSCPEGCRLHHTFNCKHWVCKEG